MNREITSADVKYAVERMARPKNGAQYAFYFTVIKGWDAYTKGKAKSIAGIKTPNAKTIVFNLASPTGDFLYRVSDAGGLPMPSEVAKCFEGKPGTYGRDVIASGPYMIEGSDDLDVSSCKAIKPISGSIGETSSRSSATRTTTRRRTAEGAGEQPRQLRVHRQHEHRRHLQQVAAGDYDDEYATASPRCSVSTRRTRASGSYLNSNSADGTYYMTMNVTQPPFDDMQSARR